MSVLQLFAFQCVLTLIMTVLINSFGSIGRGYVNLDRLLSTSNLGYNILYRILSPTVFITLTAILLYKLNLSFLITGLWRVTLYYFILNFLILVLLNRFILINKFLYLFIVVTGTVISYWVYNDGIRFGATAILPEAGNFRTELWFIIFGYFYSLLNDFSPDSSLEAKRKDRFLINRYNYFVKKYDKLLNKNFNEDILLKLVFYSMMITEDINRPFLVRLLERLLFFTGKVKTTGIMQVSSERLLSDQESIKLAQNLILDSYRKHAGVSGCDYDTVLKIAADYNGAQYGSETYDNYYCLQRLIIRG